MKLSLLFAALLLASTLYGGDHFTLNLGVAHDPSGNIVELSGTKNADGTYSLATVGTGTTFVVLNLGIAHDPAGQIVKLSATKNNDGTYTLATTGGGGGTTPTGTGFTHNTSGVQDAASVGETGTGNVVRATSPTLVTPTLGAATATTINGNTLTTGSGTLNLQTFTATVPATGTVDIINATQTLTNKTIDANNNTLLNLSVTSVKDGTDPTKIENFDVSHVSTATTRTLSFPDANTSVPIATQFLTFSGPTAARTITLPDANFTAARTDAANTFTGVQTMTSPVLITPSLGVATGTSLAIGGGSIGSDALEVTGTTTHNGGVTIAGAPFTLSGNQSVAAWTTSGVRIKGVAGTLTDTTSSGTVAAAYTDKLGGNTIAASSATTFTEYASLKLVAPVQGTNVTFTNAFALDADSATFGTSTPLKISSSGAISGGSGYAASGANADITSTTALNTLTAAASTDLTLNAGSGNQNVKLVPTGTGGTSMGGVNDNSFNHPLLYLLSDTSTGWFRNSLNQWTFASGATPLFSIINNAMIRFSSGAAINFSSAGSTSSADKGMSRISAGVMGFGNGSQGDVTGVVKGSFLSAGTATTCTGATIGTGSKNNAGFVTATTTGTSTIVITFSFTAPTGWNVEMTDQTTVADAKAVTQTASTTTTATLSGATVTGDKLSYIAMPY